MIPVVRTYRRKPVYLRNILDDQFNGGSVENHNQKVNVIEGEKSFQLDVVAPGYERNELKVTIDKNELTIASTNEEKQNKEQNYLRREFIKQSFSRTFELPENAELDKIEASHKNGILSIQIPKKAEVEVPVKEIEVK